MRNIFYYDHHYRQWFSISNRPLTKYSGAVIYPEFGLPSDTVLSLRNARKNNKFIIIQNGLYPGVPSRTLYIEINEAVRFVGKNFIYIAYGGTQTSVDSGLVKNPNVLKRIKTQYPYVVDYIDSMQREERNPFTKEDEKANYIRAKVCYDNLTEDQQMYYMIEGDRKYL